MFVSTAVEQIVCSTLSHKHERQSELLQRISIVQGERTGCRSEGVKEREEKWAVPFKVLMVHQQASC